MLHIKYAGNGAILTKEEAALFLGKSTRAVVCYVKAGKLTAHYEKNEKTSYAVYV